MNESMTYYLKPGDVIVIPLVEGSILGKIFKHYALCLGPINGTELIGQNTAQFGSVHYVEASEFLSSLPDGSYVIANDFDETTQQAIVNRALAAQGIPYNIFTFSCEHFVRYALTGIASSGQVSNTLLAGALAALLYGNRGK